MVLATFTGLPSNLERTTSCLGYIRVCRSTYRWQPGPGGKDPPTTSVCPLCLILFPSHIIVPCVPTVSLCCQDYQHLCNRSGCHLAGPEAACLCPGAESWVDHCPTLQDANLWLLFPVKPLSQSYC